MLSDFFLNFNIVFFLISRKVACDIQLNTSIHYLKYSLLQGEFFGDLLCYLSIFYVFREGLKEIFLYQGTSKQNK